MDALEVFACGVLAWWVVEIHSPLPSHVEKNRFFKTLTFKTGQLFFFGNGWQFATKN